MIAFIKGGQGAKITSNWETFITFATHEHVCMKFTSFWGQETERPLAIGPDFTPRSTSKPGLVPAAVSFPSISIFRFLSLCPLAIFAHCLAIFHDWLLSRRSSLVLSLSSSLPSHLTFSLGDSGQAIQFILLCTCGVLANWIESGTLF